VEALRLDRVTVDYPGRPGVLSEADLEVEPGRLVVLEGRSGSGKSTLLAVAAGLEAVTGGTVTVFGTEMRPESPAAAQMRATQVGLVFQHLHLLPELTVVENVELPLALARVPRRRRRQVSLELLARFGLAGLADRRPTTLSGGEQQRVAIARALALGPGLLLVDEPTSALDESNAREVVAALQAAARGGTAVVVASHDEILRGAGTLYRMQHGRPMRVRA
jgi:ABC-type lipoprotein export system ATPase subunit